MIDVGITASSKTGDAAPEVVDALGDVALLAVSGGIGYISERTIGRVLDAAAPDAWVAAWCLRWVDATSVVADLERRGLVVERLDGVTFRQRRFADDTERDFARDETERLGSTPFPDDGYHHSDLPRPPRRRHPPTTQRLHRSGTMTAARWSKDSLGDRWIEVTGKTRL